MSTNASVTVTLGHDPRAIVTISETDTGTLFFNLSDDSTLSSLNFFPEANTGSIFSPVTGVQAAVNGVNTLANGAQVADSYDVGIQFGTVASTTGGTVNQANFTLFSDTGPLSISDLDVASFATVVDSDGGNGLVLTSGDAADAESVLVSKQVLFDTFNDIHEAEESDIVAGHTNWDARWDKLVTNSHNEGVLALKTVSTDGPVTLSFDANVHNTRLFENSGWAADSLRVEVSIDGGGWVLLDEFEVNNAGTAIVGSHTGQSFGNHPGQITYEGGILDTAEDTVQFRFVSDVTAQDEWIKLDNISVTASGEISGEAVTTVLQAENFDDIHGPDDSAMIQHDARWDVRGDQLLTDGHKDGTLKTAAVAANGDVAFSFDARVQDASKFEAAGHFADHLTLQVRVEGGIGKRWTALWSTMRARHWWATPPAMPW